VYMTIAFSWVDVDAFCPSPQPGKAAFRWMDCWFCWVWGGDWVDRSFYKGLCIVSMCSFEMRLIR
jgi:hypothetical protein